MADESRVRRVAENIKVTVAQTLERKVKDPRLGFVTVTDVKVTGDLQHATVYYTVLGDEADWKNTKQALESARGLIRSEVGASLGTRLTPTIAFKADNLPQTVASIEGALREARERDAAIAEQSIGKTFAGEAEPYRQGESEMVEETDSERLEEDN